jgi:serine/threonine-protein kinase
VTTDLRDRLQRALGTAYTLDRELGGGGMSRVFVATETALGRQVVVKVLPPDLAAGVRTDRFKREIALAARLQHPHIVPLLSAGELDGVPYFTMPFITGESLRAYLSRHGEMSVSEGVRLLREIASALAYAHRNGVVHRDIKPDNVLLAGGPRDGVGGAGHARMATAMVADFGVAKALVAAEHEAVEHNHAAEHVHHATSLGVALGTPAYMSPEQATADPNTDHRADLYAFGVLAYEVLTGQTPFGRRRPSELLAAHVAERPRPVNELRPSLPPALAALIMRCLEKRPGDRPQSAGEILHTLDEITTPSAGTTPMSAFPAATATPGATPSAMTAPVAARAPAAVTTPPAATATRRRTVRYVVGAAVLALVLGTAGVAIWRARGTTPPAAVPDEHERRIAVLPFENLGDSADAYFAEGITDAVRGKLTGLSSVEVIARASSVQYRVTAKSPAEIARELGVRYLLTGTVRWAKTAGGASRVQVSPELVEVEPDGSAASRWAQPFDAEMADVFRVQGEIAGKVAEAMRLTLGVADQARLVEVPTGDPIAYDAFLRAEAMFTSGATSAAELRRTVAEYERAVRLDTAFADAWARLAGARALLYANGVPTPELGRQAREAAERALALAPDRALGHRALASYYMNVERDPRRALAEAEAARAVTPNDASVLSVLAGVYSAIGRFDEAVQSARAAARLDPRALLPLHQLRAALSALRRHREAREVADRLMALSPNLSSILDRVIVTLAEGDVAGARRFIDSVSARASQDELVTYLAIYHDLGWVLDDARQLRLLSLGPEQFDNDRATWAIVRAQVYGWRGDSTHASAWGDTASREFAAQVRANPSDAQRRAFHGLSLAYAGRRAEAIAEGERGVALLPVGRDAVNGPYQLHLLARIYLLAGERDKAIGILEQLLARPYYVSPAWLRVDPTFASLRGNHQFEKLID